MIVAKCKSLTELHYIEQPRWGDLDVNQHVNNVKYIGWILEVISSGPPCLLLFILIFNGATALAMRWLLEIPLAWLKKFIKLCVLA